MSNKADITGTYGVTNQIAEDLNIFTLNQTVAFTNITSHRPPNLEFGTATTLGRQGWNIGTQVAISTNGKMAIRQVRFDNQSFGDWIPAATATPPKAYDLPLTSDFTVIQDGYTCRYTKNQFGEVLFQISAKYVGDSPNSRMYQIATMPAGFRPSYPYEVAAYLYDQATQKIGLLTIGTEGNVNIHCYGNFPTNTYVDCSGIFFAAR